MGSKLAGQKMVFSHRLGTVPGIDAGTSQEQELLDLMPVSLMKDIGFDHQVVVNKLRRVGGIGSDSAHPGRSQEDVLGALPAEKVDHRGLIPQV